MLMFFLSNSEYVGKLNIFYIEISLIIKQFSFVFFLNIYILDSNEFHTLQSITEQNFRYMGARICRLLDAIDATPNSMFRGLLKMKMDFNQQENQHFMTNEAHKVRGTTMFLAELFLQLQNVSIYIAKLCNFDYLCLTVFAGRQSNGRRGQQHMSVDWFVAAKNDAREHQMCLHGAEGICVNLLKNYFWNLIVIICNLVMRLRSRTGLSDWCGQIHYGPQTAKRYRCVDTAYDRFGAGER